MIIAWGLMKKEDDSMACLRAVPAESLLQIFQSVSYSSTRDGNILTSKSIHNLQGGNFVKRPLLIDSNLNEGTAFILTGKTSVDTTTKFG